MLRKILFSFLILLLSASSVFAIKIRKARPEEQEQGIIGVAYPTAKELKRCAKINKNSDLLIYNFLLSNPDGLGVGQAWSSNLREPVAFIHPSDPETFFFISTFGQTGNLLLQFECARDNQALSFSSIKNKRVRITSSGEISSSSINASVNSNPPRVPVSRQLVVTKVKGSNPEINVIQGGYKISGNLSQSQVAKIRIPNNIGIFQIKNNISETVDFELEIGKGASKETLNSSIAQDESADFDKSGNIKISITSSHSNYDFDILFPELGSSETLVKRSLQ